MSDSILLSYIDVGPISGWATVVVASLALVISMVSALFVLFKEQIILNRYRPVLMLECSNEGVFFLPIPGVYRTRRLRFKITNVGNAPAKDVEVHILSVMRSTNGLTNWQEVENFLPVPVLWTHLDQVRKAELPPGTPAMIDFANLGPRFAGSRTTEESLLGLCTGCSSGDLWRYPGSKYRFEVLVTENRGEQLRCFVEVSFAHFLNTVDPLAEMYSEDHSESEIRNGNLTISMKSVLPPLAHA
jgi:hypothetical protein